MKILKTVLSPYLRLLDRCNYIIFSLVIQRYRNLFVGIACSPKTTMIQSTIALLYAILIGKYLEKSYRFVGT